MTPPATIPSVDVTEAAARADAGALIVDVREPAEFASVRAHGALLLPLSTFAVRYAELPRDRPLLMICATGNRSQAAAAHLLRNGWTEVVNVAGGTTAWVKAGLPVEHGPVQAGQGQGIPPR